MFFELKPELDLLTRSKLRTGCYRKSELYGYFYLIADGAWAELVLPPRVRASQPFWAKILRSIPYRLQFGRSERLVLYASVDVLQEVFQRIQRQLPELQAVCPPSRKSRLRQRPDHKIVPATTCEMFFWAQAAVAIQRRFNLKDPFLVEVVNNDLLSDTKLSGYLKDFQMVGPSNFLVGLDISALVMRQEESWNWFHSNFKDFSGILRCLGYRLQGKPSELLLEFQVLNDSRFLCSENKFSYSLRIDRGVASLKVANDGRIDCEWLIIDDFFVETSKNASD